VPVVRNVAAFEAGYGAGLFVAGEFADSALDNAGEQIALVGPLGEPVLDFSYDDAWYGETDGDGFLLVVIDVAGDYDVATNWRSSARAFARQPSKVRRALDYVSTELDLEPASPFCARLSAC
jgi:hypothetical protein